MSKRGSGPSMQWVKRSRKRSDHPETWDGFHGFQVSRFNERGDFVTEIRRLEEQLESMRRTVMKKDGTFKEYGSVRNKAGGGPIVMGEPEGPIGPPGPPGAQGPRGATGSSGRDGLDGNADIMIMDAIAGSTNAYGLTNHNYKMSGSMDMLASPHCNRFVFSSSPYSYRAIGMLFKPGVYQVSINFLEKVSSRYLVQFDLDNDHAFADENVLTIGTGSSNETTSIDRTYVVPHVANFYLAEFSTSTVGDYPDTTAQIVIRRVGSVEHDGTDDTLQIINGSTLTDQITVGGGLYWTGNTPSPPAGYHPNDHPSNGGTNEWAVVEQAADSGSSALAWIHRIKRFI